MDVYGIYPPSAYVLVQRRLNMADLLNNPAPVIPDEQFANGHYANDEAALAAGQATGFNYALVGGGLTDHFNWRLLAVDDHLCDLVVYGLILGIYTASTLPFIFVVRLLNGVSTITSTLGCGVDVSCRAS